MNDELPSVSSFRAFKQEYGDLKVFYPCCGFDDSPSKVFGDVLFFDRSKEAISILRNKGLNAVAGEVLDFDYSCDLMILINPSILADKLVSRFKPRFVICNNLHGTADELDKSRDYELVKMLGVDTWLFEQK